MPYALPCSIKQRNSFSCLSTSRLLLSGIELYISYFSLDVALAIFNFKCMS